MKKGIVVTEKNMMTIYDRLKKVVEKKKFFVGRSFYTRSLKVVQKVAPLVWGLNKKSSTPLCKTSHAMFGVAGICCDGSRIWLNRPYDSGYFYIQAGNKVFIDPIGKIYIERTDFMLRGREKFIQLVQEQNNCKI